MTRPLDARKCEGPAGRVEWEADHDGPPPYCEHGYLRAHWYYVDTKDEQIAALEARATAAEAERDKLRMESEHHNNLATEYFKNWQAAEERLRVAVEGLKRARFEGELPDELMDEVDAILAKLASSTEA